MALAEPAVAHRSRIRRSSRRSDSITFVPIYFDNNGNGTYEAGTDVAFDNRFATGGTYTNYATYINDGRSTPSPLFQGGTTGGSTVFKPYVIEPVNTLDSWDYTTNLNWQITDNFSLLAVLSHREYKNAFAEDTDGSPLAAQQLLQVLDHEQDTYELRFNLTAGIARSDVRRLLSRPGHQRARTRRPAVCRLRLHPRARPRARRRTRPSSPTPNCI